MNKKITQSEIARRAGIKPAHLSMIISGTRRPSWNTSKRLADVTGTDPRLWIDGDPEDIAAFISRLKGASE